MFKLFGSLMAVFALAMPVYATHCVRERVVQRVVQDYDYSYNVENVVLVPHQKFVQREFVVQSYDYQPRVVERVVDYDYQPRVVERVVERQVHRPKVVERVVERSVNRPRVRVQVRNRSVERSVDVKVQRVQKNRNVQRVRVIDNGYSY